MLRGLTFIVLVTVSMLLMPTGVPSGLAPVRRRCTPHRSPAGEPSTPQPQHQSGHLSGRL